jgi:hypothetical protein
MTPYWRKVCRELRVLRYEAQECCTKDGSRPATVAVQAEAVNRLSVLV